ncbi:MAG: hypothetical protein US22_C0019G0007 [candidate division TM6 bacterium GW2011_GWF2_36_6]|nr:MAG: hypothetical protein US22_C0019G0007 [candidate division TM6 bacterium GW2011_GWF2_36_6]
MQIELVERLTAIIIDLLISIGVVMMLHGPEMFDNVVFKRWVDKKDPCFQYVFDNVNVSEFQNFLEKNFLENELDSNYVTEFNKLLKKSSKKPYLTKSIIDFFCLDPLNPDNFELTEKTKERLSDVYKYLENDIGKFIERLKLHGFTDELINKVESKTNFLTVINKYKNFAQLLFANSDSFLTQNYLFCVANNLFEFCFYPTTAPKFEQLLKDPENYPIVRMIYSIMWNYLAGHGWKDWSKSTLSVLKDLTKNGGAVVYIAGGTDIYQLLKYGIYNITVIDPVLPSQPNYYSDIWDWLVVSKTENNGIGDVVNYNFGDRKIVMKRTSFNKTGSFQAELSFGKIIDIIQSRTQWTVYDDLGNELGNVIFERRFCRQDDFVKKDNSHLLISFNELYYIASNNLNDSWGIDISKIGDNFKMFVKQLQSPIDKNVLCNMQKADNSDFSFIKLGSNTN